MKKNVLIKKIFGNDTVKQNPTTGASVHLWKGTTLNPTDENTVAVAKDEVKSKMQPIDEFRYSGRCFCGNY